jgi:hypothetical protein
VIGSALLALAAFTAPAGAHPVGGGPYGSTTTTAGRSGSEVSCQLKTRAAAPGERASVQVRSVDRGASVEVRFDGSTVAEAEATQAGSSPRVNVDIDFVVPASARPGRHLVTASGADFSVACRTGDGDDFVVADSEAEPRAEVAGNTVERSGGSEAAAGSESPAGALPMTGAYIAVLFIIGLLLVLVGSVIVKTSPRRLPDGPGQQRRRRRTPSGG